MTEEQHDSNKESHMKAKDVLKKHPMNPVMESSMVPFPSTLAYRWNIPLK